MRNREVTFLTLVLILTGLALWIDFAPADDTGVQRWLGYNVSTRLGLDLQGGTQVLLRSQDPNVSTDVMNTAVGVVDRRVNGLGVSEAVVQRSGNDRIIVELPGVTNPEQAVTTLRSTGRLEFIANENGQGFTAQDAPPAGSLVRTSGNSAPIIPAAAIRPTPTAPISGTGTLSNTGALSNTGTVSGTGTVTGTNAVSGTETLNTGPVYQSITEGADLDSGAVAPNYGNTTNNLGANQYGVNFGFVGTSATKLAEFTGQNVQRQMCIVLDNVVYSCPVIQSALLGGSGQITTATRQDADNIYNQLKYGSLPVSLNVESSRTVSATLGADSVRASLIAGLVGLVVVALFMILYYRLPGVLATIALFIYTALIFAIYKLVPITLTLAGIAGFILSIGLAVDANVLIFARLKEELRRGRSLRNAVELGFNEAWPAIRDSSASTLITSVILFLFGNSFGVSIIKGFALTLGLGILISLFTAVVVTRTLLRLIVGLRFAQNPWMFELEDAPGLRQARGETVATDR